MTRSFSWSFSFVIVALVGCATKHPTANRAVDRILSLPPAYAPSTFPVSAGRRPPVTYRFDPVDLTTHYGSGTLQVWFSNSGDPVGDAVLTAATKQISLVAWPEMTIVPTAARVTEADSQAGAYVARVFIEPQRPLQDRWYALRVAGEIQGASLALDPGNAAVAPDGATVARFRVGSELTLVAATQQKKQDGKYSLRFAYSEPIDTPEDETAARITLDGKGLDCEVPVGAGPAYGHAVTFLCARDHLRGARRLVHEPPWTATGAKSKNQEVDMTSKQRIVLPDGAEYMKLK